MNCAGILIGVFCIFAGFYLTLFALLNADLSNTALGGVLLLGGALLLRRGRGQRG